MFCSNCGKPISEGARFCTECGSPVSATPEKPKDSLRSVIAAFKEGMNEAHEDVELAPFNPSKIYKAWVIFLMIIGTLSAAVGLLGAVLSVSDSNYLMALSSLFWLFAGASVAIKAHDALHGRLEKE